MQQLYDEGFVSLDPKNPTIQALEQFRMQVKAFDNEYRALESQLDAGTLQQYFGEIKCGIPALLKQAQECIDELTSTLKSNTPQLNKKQHYWLTLIYTDFNKAALAWDALRRTLPQTTSHTGLAVKISLLVLVAFFFLIAGIAFIPAAGAALLSGALFLANILGLTALQAVLATASATLLPWMLGGMAIAITSIPLAIVNAAVALSGFVRNTWPKEQYSDRLLTNPDNIESDSTLLPDIVMLNIATPSWPKNKKNQPLPLELITGNKSCYLLYQGHIYHANYPYYKNPFNLRACTQVVTVDENMRTEAITQFPEPTKGQNYALAPIKASQFNFFAVLHEKDMLLSKPKDMSTQGLIN